MDQINTRTYNSNKIDERCFCDDRIYTRENEMRLTCSGIFDRKYIYMIFFITLCKKSTGVSFLNILRIITIIYHMYIGYELYNLAYLKRFFYMNIYS